MADFSSFVSVEIDEAGRPLYLESTVEGDNIASNLFPYNVNHAASAFPTADAHLAALTVSSSELSTAIDNGVAYNDAPLVASAVQLSAAITANDGDIANMVVSASELSAAIDGISVGSYDDSLLQAASGNWNNTSSVVDSASGNWNNVFSDVDSTSATWDLAKNRQDTSANPVWNLTKEQVTTSANPVWNLAKELVDASANSVWNLAKDRQDTSANSVWNLAKEQINASANPVWNLAKELVDVAVTDIDTNETAIANMVVSATDLSAAIDASAAVLAQVLSISDTSFLGGATPTLANNLVGGGNEIQNVSHDQLCTHTNLIQKASGATFEISSVGDTVAKGLLKMSAGDNKDGEIRLLCGEFRVNQSNGTGIGGDFTTSNFSLSAANWSQAYAHSTDGSTTHPSGTASGILVGPGSSITISGAEGESVLGFTGNYGHLAAVKSEAKGKWLPDIWLLEDVHTGRIIPNSAISREIYLNGMTLTETEEINADTMITTADLSAGPSATVKFDATNITVGTCPIPPPWAYSQVNVQNGVNTSDPFYHASGCTQGVDESNVNHINWINADCYFSISATGTYEFEFVGTLIATTAACDVALTMQKTTGLGLTETPKSILDTYLAIANKPWPIAMKYTGDVTAGEFFTLKIDGSNNIRQGRGSSFNCRRLA